MPLNPYNLEKSIDIITEHYRRLLEQPVKTISLGGDHTITLPILRAQANRYGPLAVIHDAVRPAGLQEALAGA